MGEGGLALEKYADSRATFKVLVELPREDLERLFTALLCGRIGSWNPRYAYEPSTHDSPFAMILAEHLGARLNWADIPQEFWQAFGKERIGQMVGAFNKAYAHINFASRKEAIRTLLELTRVKPDQPLPEELQFQTKQGGNGLVVVASEPSGDVDDLEAEKVLEAA